MSYHPKFIKTDKTIYEALTYKQKKKIDYVNSVCNKFSPRKGRKLFAFTVKVLKRSTPIDESSYEKFFSNLYKYSNVWCYCGEEDTKSVLHYHGVIEIKNSLKMNKLRVKGYHIYFKRCFNYKQWMDYCFKNNIYYCWSGLEHALN